jgi:hypothetical protein
LGIELIYKGVDINVVYNINIDYLAEEVYCTPGKFPSNKRPEQPAKEIGGFILNMTNGRLIRQLSFDYVGYAAALFRDSFYVMAYGAKNSVTLQGMNRN